MDREDIAFTSGGVRCAAWLYRPPNASGAAPCVVLGHGFSATRSERLDAFAERFAAAGLAALCFDYRGFGDSEGEPRQFVSIRGQLEDWRAAVAVARALDVVEPNLIALWGSSFSGGHVLRVASEDSGIAAVIAQVPFTDGLATVRALGAAAVLRNLPHALLDQARGLLGRSPHYIPAIGPPGSVGLMTTLDSRPGFLAIVPNGSRWRNEASARVLLWVPLYRPGRRAARIRAPLFMAVAETDSLAPPQPAIRAARGAANHVIRTYPGGHFTSYIGEPFERLVADETAFLVEHLLERRGTTASPVREAG